MGLTKGNKFNVDLSDLIIIKVIFTIGSLVNVMFHF
jgi:hypothetical protein